MPPGLTQTDSKHELKERRLISEQIISSDTTSRIVVRTGYQPAALLSRAELFGRTNQACHVYGSDTQFLCRFHYNRAVSTCTTELAEKR